jgi:hypothetical protein
MVLRRLEQIGSLAFHAVPLLLVGILWFSVFHAYYVSEITCTDAMVNNAREFPPDYVLNELKDFDLLEMRWKNNQQVVASATELLAGHLQFHDCSTRITIPFSPRDLDHVLPSCELPIAAFYVPDLLVRAYEASGRSEFLSVATEFITEANKYERTARLPRGQFWNDHALASRVLVLANFWRLYRKTPNYQPGVARAVIQLVAHSEALLARPSQFTFATNHGIMQNLALWHATLAFPSLPNGAQYQELALWRMNQQMKFYISDEGVVLEHSAGYQLFGLELLTMAFRYLEMMHRAVPENWILKYDRAQRVYDVLRRPDGSLPVFGDTEDGNAPGVSTFTELGRDQRTRPVNNTTSKPAEEFSLFPVSGLSIYWDGLDSWPKSPKLSQTVITWGNFVGHGHKHADEMSLLFWAGGQNWWSNAGYWPYGDERRSSAVSWDGSNAPHLLGEDPAASRTTRLIASAQGNKLWAIELERSGGNYIFHREVIHWKPSLWIVLDSTRGPKSGRTTTIWTTPSNISWQQSSSQRNSFFLKGGNSNRLQVFISGSPSVIPKFVSGSVNPFAGWQVEGGLPVPAPALVVEQPAESSWAATIWIWEKSIAPFLSKPLATSWTGAGDWEVHLSDVTFTRTGNMLRFHSKAGDDGSVLLFPSIGSDSGRVELTQNLAAVAAEYHRFYEQTKKRSKVTYLLLVGFVFQEILAFLFDRLRKQSSATLRLAIVIGWIIGGIWLVFVYF